jgi:hypothetical protein
MAPGRYGGRNSVARMGRRGSASVRTGLGAICFLHRDVRHWVCAIDAAGRLMFVAARYCVGDVALVLLHQVRLPPFCCLGLDMGWIVVPRLRRNSVESCDCYSRVLTSGFFRVRLA